MGEIRSKTCEGVGITWGSRLLAAAYMRLAIPTPDVPFHGCSFAMV